MSSMETTLTERVAEVLAQWGVRSMHGEWSDAEAQRSAAVAVLRVATAPVVITDWDVLNALPVGSVVLDPRGMAWQQRRPAGQAAGWWRASWHPRDARLTADILPATLLHRGGE